MQRSGLKASLVLPQRLADHKKGSSFHQGRSTDHTTVPERPVPYQHDSTVSTQDGFHNDCPPIHVVQVLPVSATNRQGTFSGERLLQISTAESQDTGIFPCSQ